MLSFFAVRYSSNPLSKKCHFGHVGGADPNMIFILQRTARVTTCKSKERRIRSAMLACWLFGRSFLMAGLSQTLVLYWESLTSSLRLNWRGWSCPLWGRLQMVSSGWQQKVLPPEHGGNVSVTPHPRYTCTVTYPDFWCILLFYFILFYFLLFKYLLI